MRETDSFRSFLRQSLADLKAGDKKDEDEYHARTSISPEIMRALSEYELVLLKNTDFPRAGTVNRYVIEYVDLVMGFWKAGGKQSEDAIFVINVRLECCIWIYSYT